MASFHFPLLLLLLPLFLLLQPLSSIANLRKINTTLLKSNLIEQINHTLVNEITYPTVFFEVTKPIKVPTTKRCNLHNLQRQFADTTGKRLVVSEYHPPDNCGSQDFSKIVLQWTASCKGRQFDRIFGVWLSGVELFRSSTPRPKQNGAVWTVRKDITKYYSLLMKKETQELVVYLSNVADETYAGIYHVTINIYSYPEEKSMDNMADLILPISRNAPLNDGLWFYIKSDTNIQSTEFTIPQNVYKAVLEVYVSFHDEDEFWYRNLPNSYIDSNNLKEKSGNGPFREVLVRMDNELVGAIWPFTVIYNGGVDPNLWRPITGIGSFDLPSYDIDITPFLETMLDGQMLTISFEVVNALNFWLVDANLQLWLDHKSEKTIGRRLSKHIHPSSYLSNEPHFHGLIGNYTTKAQRSISLRGSVQSSYGTITSRFSQKLDYSNVMTIGNNGKLQIVDQKINLNEVYDEEADLPISLTKSTKKFHIYLKTDSIVDQENDNTTKRSSEVTLQFDDEEKQSDEDGKTATSLLVNIQKVKGVMEINKDNEVTGVSASTAQYYRFEDVGSCYLRNIKTKNFVVDKDKEDFECKKSMPIR